MDLPMRLAKHGFSHQVFVPHLSKLQRENSMADQHILQSGLGGAVRSRLRKRVGLMRLPKRAQIKALGSDDTTGNAAVIWLCTTSRFKDGLVHDASGNAADTRWIYVAINIKQEKW